MVRDWDLEVFASGLFGSSSLLGSVSRMIYDCLHELWEIFSEGSSDLFGVVAHNVMGSLVGLRSPQSLCVSFLDWFNSFLVPNIIYTSLQLSATPPFLSDGYLFRSNVSKENPEVLISKQIFPKFAELLNFICSVSLLDYGGVLNSGMNFISSFVLSGMNIENVFDSVLYRKDCENACVYVGPNFESSFDSDGPYSCDLFVNVIFIVGEEFADRNWFPPMRCNVGVGFEEHIGKPLLRNELDLEHIVLSSYSVFLVTLLVPIVFSYTQISNPLGVRHFYLANLESVYEEYVNFMGVSAMDWIENAIDVGSPVSNVNMGTSVEEELPDNSVLSVKNTESAYKSIVALDTLSPLMTEVLVPLDSVILLPYIDPFVEGYSNKGLVNYGGLGKNDKIDLHCDSDAAALPLVSASLLLEKNTPDSDSGTLVRREENDFTTDSNPLILAGSETQKVVTHGDLAAREDSTDISALLAYVVPSDAEVASNLSLPIKKRKVGLNAKTDSPSDSVQNEPLKIVKGVDADVYVNSEFEEGGSSRKKLIVSSGGKKKKKGKNAGDRRRKSKRHLCSNCPTKAVGAHDELPQLK